MLDLPYYKISRSRTQFLGSVKGILSPNSFSETVHFDDAIRDVNARSQRMLSPDVTASFSGLPVVETMDYTWDYVSTEGIRIGIQTEFCKEIKVVPFQFDVSIYRWRRDSSGIFSSATADVDDVNNPASSELDASDSRRKLFVLADRCHHSGLTIVALPAISRNSDTNLC
ncbi:hypothetical protein FBUS_10807 [Fasciolopsis buskii]|uniref:Uncharacterized protein n=1 Tax=Fasciolopsis buskii TaxID=27845 RepID=A0A8E0RRD1_9TREM|nr:hypothetical protein FBUS_10807 [Fasciolopsis buski]